MNCWKSVNLRKENNTTKMTIMSVGFSFLTFMFTFLIFSSLQPETQLKGIGLEVLLLIMLMIYPLHSILHAVPLWMIGIATTWKFDRDRRKQLPVIKYSFSKPVSRNMYVIAMISPFIILGTASIAGAVLMPGYMHYFLIIFSLNSGMALHDFAFIRQLVKAPKHCTVERKLDGMDIVLKQPS